MHPGLFRKELPLNEEHIVAELSVDQAHELITSLSKAIDVVDSEAGIDLLISNSGEHQVSGRFEYSGGFEQRFNNDK